MSIRFNRKMLVICLGLSTAMAHAQSTRNNLRAQAPDNSAAEVSTAAVAVENAPSASSSPGCQDYDRFASRGSEQPIITTCETLSPDLLGLRPKLYENGWMLMGFYNATETYDVRNQSEGPQSYNGERPSFSGMAMAILTYDLSRLGWLGQKSQLTFEAASYRFNYRDGGVNDDATVGQLSIEQRFANDRVRIQYGYYGASGQFMGGTLGTSSAASALGPSSSLPTLVGMSGFKPVPGVDVRLYSKSGRFYDHFGVLRSQSPEGFQADAKANPTGLKWSIDGAKPLYINELGYRVASGAGTHMTWIRQGVIYNRSLYEDFSKPGTKGRNNALYLMADQQLTQPDEAMPYRGWYVGLKADRAASEHNIFDSDFAVTVYNMAPFAARPGDMVAFAFSRNNVSEDAVELLHSQGMAPVRYSTSASVSYALRAGRGVYWVNGLNYTRKPLVTSPHPDVANLSTSLTFSF